MGDIGRRSVDLMLRVVQIVDEDSFIFVHCGADRGVVRDGLSGWVDGYDTSKLVDRQLLQTEIDLLERLEPKKEAGRTYVHYRLASELELQGKYRQWLRSKGFLKP